MSSRLDFLADQLAATSSNIEVKKAALEAATHLLTSISSGRDAGNAKLIHKKSTRKLRQMQQLIESEQQVRDAEEALKTEELRLVRLCNEAAVEALFRGGPGMWSRLFTEKPPSRPAIDSAMKYLKTAELALDGPVLTSMERWALNSTKDRYSSSSPTQGLTADNSTPFERPPPNATSSASGFSGLNGQQSFLVSGERFMGLWPRILSCATGATIRFVGGRSRCALAYSKRGMQLLLEAMPQPHLIVAQAMQFTHSQAVCEQLVSLVTSHAAILYKMDRPDDALPVAQLACTLARDLHDELLHKKTKKLAEEEKEMLNDNGKHWAGFGWSMHEAQVGALVGNTEVGMLLSFALYNCACITASMGSTKRSEVVSLYEASMRYATSHLGAQHAFTQHVASKVHAATIQPTALRGSRIVTHRHRQPLAESSQTTTKRLATANTTLQGLRDLHGRAVQRRVLSAHSIIAQRKPNAKRDASVRVAAPSLNDSWVECVVPV